MRRDYACLIEVFDESNQIRYRRIALNISNAIDWIYELAQRFENSKVHEDGYGISGVIDSTSHGMMTYNVTHISIV